MTTILPTSMDAQAAKHRFLGVEGLYSPAALRALANKHVLIFGIGGVGGWAVEMLCRSGIGSLSLVDPDEVCISNVNRQITALEDAIGKPKIEVMASRLRLINPACHITTHQRFLTSDNIDHFFAAKPDYVIDAIDDVSPKCRLLSYCRSLSIPVVSAGAAGGIRQPWQIKTCDFADSYNDLLLARCRKKLRQDLGFPRQGAFGIPCVFSSEKAETPASATCDTDQHWFSEPKRFDCSAGYGSAGFITATFGNFMAAIAINALADGH